MHEYVEQQINISLLFLSKIKKNKLSSVCLLYTSDAADETSTV